MARIVLVVDCSGSMSSELPNIKTFLKAWVYGLTLHHDVGLIYFDHDVYIGSHYTKDPVKLKDAIQNIQTGADRYTAMHDAIHVAIAFAGFPNQHLCPNKLIVFSDKGDNSSCTDEDNWIAKIDKCNIDVCFYPLEAFDDPKLRAHIKLFTKNPIKPSEALENWRKLEKRTKRVKILEKPDDFLEMLPKKD